MRTRPACNLRRGGGKCSQKERAEEDATDLIMRSVLTLLALSTADASFRFTRAGLPTQSVQNPALVLSKNPASQVLLPAAAYAGLAGTTAGAIKLMTAAGTTAAGPYALMAYCVGLPVALISAQLLTAGGPGVAKSMGGVPADEALTSLAHDAAMAVGVTPPAHVFIIPRKEPNAFAASSLGNGAATVAITQGLRELLSRDELSAVLAHEMGHLRYKDVARNMHVAIAVTGLGGIWEAGRMVLRSAARDSNRTRKKKKDEGSGGVYTLGLGLMGLGAAAQGVAHLVQLSASRGAELRADLAAAEAYGAQSLIRALRKIHDAADASDLRSSEAGKKMAFAMISDGRSPSPSPVARPSTPPAQWSVRRTLTSIGRALRTHPPLDERIAALEAAEQSGIVPRDAKNTLRSTWWW